MPPPPDGLIDAIATPTCREPGAVYPGAVGATRSTASVRATASGALNPAFEADTDRSRLVPVMYAASAGTGTDQVAVPLTSAEVALRGVPPIVTVTLTPASVPVSPEISNPDAFSAMFTTSSVAMAATFRTREPAA